MERHTISVLVNGQEMIFETGKVARQANGSVILRVGDTMILATACATHEPLPDVDFLPLRVDFQEKFSSTGKTVSGFIKREGKPTQSEILTSRLIDRPLRPMFEDGYYHDTQILASVISYDGVHRPDVLAICAASCALAISDIPLVKPISGVRVGLIENEFIINPTVEQQKHSKLDLVLAGTEDAVLMIEGASHFLTEEEILKAIEIGHDSIKKICQTIKEFQRKTQSNISRQKSSQHWKSSLLISSIQLFASWKNRSEKKPFPKLSLLHLLSLPKKTPPLVMSRLMSSGHKSCCFPI
jgi:polyribonucleotide nucleotidyltransferase